jgi:hypothetical protein
MSGLVYGGKFEQTMNELCNAQNIAATAKKFAELEKQYGPYSFGKFVKFLLPRPGEFAGWDKDSGGYPSRSADASPRSSRPISDPNRRCRWC